MNMASISRAPSAMTREWNSPFWRTKRTCRKTQSAFASSAAGASILLSIPCDSCQRSEKVVQSQARTCIMNSGPWKDKSTQHDQPEWDRAAQRRSTSGLHF